MTLRASLLYAKKIIFSKNISSENEMQRHGKRSLKGAMISIGISLIPLVILLVVSNGMINGMTARIIHLSSNDIQVTIDNKSDGVRTYTNFLNTAECFSVVEEVTGVNPEVRCSALACGKTYRSGASVRAVSPDVFQKDKYFKELFTVVEGKCELAGSKDAIIGEKLASVLNVQVGDKIKIVTVNNNFDVMTLSSKVFPKISVFTVKGIVSSGYQELDSLWVFIPLKSAYTSLALSNCQFVVGLDTDLTFKPELVDIQRKIQLLSYKIPGIGYPSIERWDQVSSAQYQNFSSTKALLFLIVMLIVLVASINISSALVMLVMERQKEIAVLKSCGATSKGITLSFLLVGLSCGIGGLLIGIPVGLLCAVNVNHLVKALEGIINFFTKMNFMIFTGGKGELNQFHLLNPDYYIQKIDINVPFGELFGICILTLLLSLLMASIPAIKAGKEKPISTLRKM